MKYKTPKEMAQKWGISQRRVHTLCLEGRIEGAERHGWIWIIPETAKKPEDARIKSGRYMKVKQNLFMEQKQLGVTDNVEFVKIISRPHLIEKLSRLHSRVTYIHAGVGYGKTTLLLQYARSHEHVVWLSLDGRDNEVLFFLDHLEASIGEKLKSLKFHFSDYISLDRGKTLIDTALPAFLQAMGEDIMTIIIDDVHVIVNDTITRFLTQWVKMSHQNVTIIMASRHELWSDLFRLKMDGVVSELTKMDLCFSQEEAGELWGFFDAEAYSLTEGWILGMQSYGMIKEGNKKWLAPKLHRERDLYRYLLNEVLMRLPYEIQHFLKSVSWLSVLEVSMCNSLLGITDSQEIFEDLIARNVFTSCISDLSYQFHPLFRSFLQQNDNGLGQKTLRKAMTLCYGNEDYEQAADYALILKDGAFMQDCINAILRSSFNRKGRWELKKYIEFLEGNHVELQPCALLAKGMDLSKQGDFYEAERYLGAAIPNLNKEDKIIYLHAMTHMARVLRNRVSLEESNRCIDSLLPMLEDMPMEDWYEVIIEKIHSLTITSQLSDALKLTLKMMEKSLISGSSNVKSWFERYLTVIYFYMGDYRNCLKAYEKSLSISKKEQDWLMRHSVGAYAAKAYQITGQEEKVLPLLNYELERLVRLGLNEEFSMNYLLYAEVLHTIELLKLYQGKGADFSDVYRYLDLAEEHAFLNRSTHDHYIFVKVWKACAELLNHPEKADQCIRETLLLMEGTTPFFKSLAYGRIANALDTLGQNPEQCKEYFIQSIKIGENIGSYAYATVAYGRMAAIFLDEGKIEAAKEYTCRFLELSYKYGHYYYIRFKPLFASVLKLAEECSIEPQVTREMLNYGGYISKRVYINTLGNFYIAPSQDRKNPIKIRTQKARELLAYFLKHPRGVTKEQIFADLWWDSEANVNSLFHTRRGEIRRAFESMGAGNPIFYEGGLYRLNMDEIICDYDGFKEAVEEFQQHLTVEKAQIVVENYSGRYLNNMEALWAEGFRLQLEDNFLEAAEFLLENYTESEERVKKIDLIRKMNR